MRYPSIQSANSVSILLVLSLTLIINITTILYAEENLTGFSIEVKKMAEECRQEIIDEFEKLIFSDKLKSTQLFDTFYIPIPETYPQKYHTQYDEIFDKTIQSIIDKYLEKDKRIIFAIAVDKNGYVPTHNKIFSQPLIGEREIDSINNRTKRLFNDRTGLAASRNEAPYLLQKYNRDTGELIYDLSVPIMFRNQHWGALRIGFKE